MNDKLTIRGKHSAGFTLIELLTVMAIMVTMAGIAIGSYFALMRGAGLRSAVDTVRNTLLLARQSAIMESKKAHVVFGTRGTTMWCMLCMHEGTVTGISGGGSIFYDRYGDMGRVVGGVRIYNLSSEPVESTVVNTIVHTNGQWVVTTGDRIWSQDDNYGWSRGSELGLPKGYFYGSGVPEEPETVVFNTDGSVRMQGYTIRVHEEINPGYVVKVTVEGMTGFINVEYP